MSIVRSNFCCFWRRKGLTFRRSILKLHFKKSTFAKINAKLRIRKANLRVIKNDAFFLQVELDDYGIRLIKVDETPEFSPFE